MLGPDVQVELAAVPDSVPLKVAVEVDDEPLPPPDLLPEPDPPPAPAVELPEQAARPTTRAAATRKIGRVRCEIAMI
jgi:hypothetical protein